MADYAAKKAEALKRLETLAADKVRIAQKEDATKKLIAECDRMLAEQKAGDEKKE